MFALLAQAKRVDDVQSGYSGLIILGLTILVLMAAFIWWLRR
ncbi:MAG: hypothetical protein QM770_12255 [Tepidisphaeraceae bacterium]